MIFGRIKNTLFQEQSETEELQENLFSHHDKAEPTESVFPSHDQEEQTEYTFSPQDQDQTFQEEQPISDDVTADQLIGKQIPDQLMKKQLTDQPAEEEDTTPHTTDKQQIATQNQTTSKIQKVKAFQFCNNYLNSTSLTHCQHTKVCRHSSMCFFKFL